jgi:hypothetical protein
MKTKRSPIQQHISKSTSERNIHDLLFGDPSQIKISNRARTVPYTIENSTYVDDPGNRE